MTADKAPEMSRSSRKERGAASVEAAISMLLIIPAFLYALFLDDLLRYAGDLQEAVTSTPWDFIGQDYTPKKKTRGLLHEPGSAPVGGATKVQRQARLMFCDHESSGDSYDQGQDCGAQDHHAGKALSGHICWLNPGARQVTCDPVQPEVGLLKDNRFQQYHGEFSAHGGLYDCHAKSVVENYLMPKSFLQEFSQVKLSKKNWKSEGSDYHANSIKGASDTAYYLEEQHFSLVTDSWAVNSPPSPSGTKDALAMRPDDKNPKPKRGKFELFDRVDHVYRRDPVYPALDASAKLFRTGAVSQQLLSGSGTDDPLVPAVSLQKVQDGPPTQNIREEGRTRKYFATPWKDWSRDAHEKTGQARGKYYLGCKTPEGC